MYSELRSLLIQHVDPTQRAVKAEAIVALKKMPKMLIPMTIQDIGQIYFRSVLPKEDMPLLYPPEDFSANLQSMLPFMPLPTVQKPKAVTLKGYG